VARAAVRSLTGPRAGLVPAVILLAYGACLAWLMLGPQPLRPVYAITFAVRPAFVTDAPQPAVPQSDIGPFSGTAFQRATWTVTAVGNVAVFVPLGVLLPLLITRLDGALAILAVAIALSVAIEVVQLAAQGDRTPQVSDVAFNVAGAMVGFGLLRVARQLRSHA
jgi:glycopeptide antibiotics resistance protein